MPLAILLLLALPTFGCSVGRAARGAAEAGFDGAKDAARKWWVEEGEKLAAEKAGLLADRAGSAVREKLDEKLTAYKEDLGKKVADGTASATETAMYWALGGGGGAAGLLGLLLGRRKPDPVIPPA